MNHYIADEKHEAAYQDVVALLKRHPELTAPAMLALAANLVGKLMALQDQRQYSVDACLEIIQMNMELGNKQMVDQLLSSKGSA